MLFKHVTGWSDRYLDEGRGDAYATFKFLIFYHLSGAGIAIAEKLTQDICAELVDTPSGKAAMDKLVGANKLRDRLRNLEHSAAMACIEPDDDCTCAGCMAAMNFHKVGTQKDG
jgi:hypothetical protein